MIIKILQHMPDITLYLVPWLLIVFDLDPYQPTFFIVSSPPSTHGVNPDLFL